MSGALGNIQGRFVVPEVVSSHFHIREGDTVADFGAGSGYFIEVLSGLVGPSGVVYACDIQKDLIEKLGTFAHSKRLSNVRPLWCDMEETNGIKIEADVLDCAIMVNAFFQIEDKHTALQEISRTLRKGGKLCIIDWTESFGGLGPHPDQVITADDVQAIAETEGFSFDRSFDSGDHHYGLAFRKI